MIAPRDSLAHPAKVPGPRRVSRSPEDLAEAARVKADRLELRRREVAALEAACPSLALASEDVRFARARQLHPSVNLDGALVRIERPNGSALVAAARDYDGTAGGTPQRMVTLFCAFRDAGGLLVRTQGTAIHEAELRPLALALLAEAERVGA